MNEASDVTDINEEQLDLAIRKRIQSVALCHLVDDNIDGVSAFRFKAAGTFESDLTRNNPCDIAELIAVPTHERRIGEEDSLLIFVKDVQEPMSAGVIDLSDHLLESDIEIRRASLEAISRLRSLMLPCTAKIIVDSVMEGKSSTFRVIDSLVIDEAVAKLVGIGFPSKRLWSNQC